MDAKLFQLKQDLAFARHYKMICGLMVEYYDDGDFVFTKEEAQERVDGCEKIITNIKKRMEAIDE